MLFACFEILSSHYDSAIKHIRSGIKIMNEVYCDPRSGTFCHPFLRSSTVTALEMDSLRKMLVRLQDQALTLTREEVDMQLSQSVPIREIDIEIPEVFRSIGEARDIFEYYRSKAGRQFRALDGADPDKFMDLIHHYSPLLEKLTVALNNFEHTRGPLLTARDKTGLNIIRIYQKMQYIILEYGKLGISDQRSWDNYNFIFEEIVTLAASVVDSAQGIECLSLSPSQLAELSRNGRLKPSFSLDMGIISPVYNVATLCRDPVIRRKALAVLRSMSRQEGVFNSHACALVAEQAIAIEERMAAGMALNHQDERSLLMLLPGTRPSWQSETTEINHSDEIPDSARLTYIHPTIKIADKNVCLTIGQPGKHMDIPVPALTAMLDLVTL
ncbi:predicted protein [Aspergillus terreus NIH2624]|uniref:Uncharacterized protein n=1 Tax=Aspergillus terreus (strain NIH 2624 / FGSC A1156) TaxID=341663 RepID=Q0CY89_ASPTN|nr:uncharacterized protein ATEG_01345 [Aspergillus terreus NIH2624]EAU38102.1 predicted protein [Aspergillus terreus NIH2624]